jgi:LysR family glycine cleavage system transcriptional activator
MSRRLPPLNGLRAFEAAARHMSFTRAAEELSVTPGAISQQIRSLEDHLGKPLFRRGNRSLLLTDAGQACLPYLRDGFDRLAEGIARLNDSGRDRTLRVSVAPSFASKWLVPRLDDFTARHPELEVWMGAANTLVDFGVDDVDMAIRYGGGRYPGLFVDELMRESVFPVCSPKLVSGAHPLTGPEALVHHTLLHDDSSLEDVSCPDWAMWLRAAGIDAVDGGRGPRFNQSSLVLEAAASGRGVALAKSALAAVDIAEGRLVRPFEAVLPVNFAYYVVCPQSRADLRKVVAFRDWLRVQAAEPVSGEPRSR